MSRKTYCLILAAGDGKRMKSDKPKVLCEVLFKPMLTRVIESARLGGADSICAVVGSHKEQVITCLERNGINEYYEQTERKGTGHAVMQALPFIKKAKEDNADLLITYGDAPFVDSDTIKESLAFHRAGSNDVTVISAEIENPTGYGRIVKENGEFVKIVEEKDCTPDEKKITEINSGIYWFNPEKLVKYLDKLTPDNAAGEYYLTDTVYFAEKRSVFTAKNPDVVKGANSRKQLAELNESARMAVIDKLYDMGVDIPVTDGIIIADDVVIGTDTVILPGTILKSGTVIGKNCVIGPNSLIENCKIADGVILNNVQAFDSVMDDNVKAGPFVHIRPGTHLLPGVKIGDFVEIKNSEIGINTCVAHLTYLGDSTVGKSVNFGCGCVTANYDGEHKFRTEIGDYAFIGCNTNLIAPVKIGENATTAAGSTITKDVPENSLAIERGETAIKENWEKNFTRIRKA